MAEKKVQAKAASSSDGHDATNIRLYSMMLNSTIIGAGLAIIVYVIYQIFFCGCS
jgi:hypothetical protein